MARVHPRGQWTVRITSVVRDARPGARNLSGWTGTIVHYHVFACSALAVFVLAFLTDKGVSKPIGIWSSTTSYRSSSFSCAIHLSYWVLFERWPEHFLGPNTCNWNGNYNVDSYPSPIKSGLGRPHLAIFCCLEEFHNHYQNSSTELEMAQCPTASSIQVPKTRESS
ncbi:hypothetical protein EDB84DRAFT_834821 [Lactarius hengduanensis]|nr:hypothetical protein EDB84DRAFT_834821 [Lactarius hengduanensis]